MRKPEQRLYDSMKANCADGVRLERIENGVGSGAPDVHAIRLGVTRWIELKVVKRPVRDTTPLIKNDTLRREQKAWHLSYHSAGGQSFILVRDDQRQLYLFPGSMVLHLPDVPLRKCLELCAHPNWHAVYKEIFR